MHCAISEKMLFLLFISYLSLTEAKYTVDQIRQLATLCKAEPDDLEVSIKYEVPETKSGKCLMTCMLKNLNVLTADNQFNATGSLKTLQTFWAEIPNEELEKVVDVCGKVDQTSDSCENGYLVIKCINGRFKALGAL